MTAIQLLSQYLSDNNKSENTNDHILTIAFRRSTLLTSHKNTDIKSLPVFLLSEFVDNVQFISETL